MEIIYTYILKLFILALILALLVSSVWYSTDMKGEFKTYRKRKGGKWFLYKVDDVEFWSDDWTLPHTVIKYEEH